MNYDIYTEKKFYFKTMILNGYDNSKSHFLHPRVWEGYKVNCTHRNEEIENNVLLLLLLLLLLLFLPLFIFTVLLLLLMWCKLHLALKQNNIKKKKKKKSVRVSDSVAQQQHNFFFAEICIRKIAINTTAIIQLIKRNLVLLITRNLD